MRYLIAIASLFGAAPALANPPGADYCMSKFNLCMSNAAGPTQAGYCRANMNLCMKKPPTHRTADELRARGHAPGMWTTTTKPR
jgi:hypothetical protein